MNDQIRVTRVLVIDEVGNKLGEFLTEDAIALALERNLDLVEVAPTARPPVCRIADFGKLKYEKKKKDAAARKNQAVISIKEVKISPKTDVHDFDVKTRHARRFLEDGDKVKITCRFRGREMVHREFGEAQCNRLATALGDLALVESPARMDGRQMSLILAPRKAK